MVTHIGYSAAGRSGGRVTLCAVCTVHEVRVSWSTVCEWFAFNTTQTVCEWFGLKTTQTVFSSLTLKSVARVSRFGPQNRQLRFDDLSLKIIMTVF
jgi:hypothetical protein